MLGLVLCAVFGCLVWCFVLIVCCVLFGCCFTVVWFGLFVWGFAFGLIFVAFLLLLVVGFGFGFVCWWVLGLVDFSWFVWFVWGGVVMIFSDLCWVITLVMLCGFVG